MRGRAFDVVVVGLGALGSAAAYQLSKRLGAGVLGLEQFEVGHDRGASQDHSRIIRRSYHTPGYVRLADEAYRAWREVEGEAGQELVVTTGGLDLWPHDAAIPMKDYVDSMAAEGVEFEELDAAETMRRWPQWRLTEDVRLLFQPDAGLLAAMRCNDAHRRLAREHGATLADRTRVVAIDPAGREATVRTDDGRAFTCGKVIVATDAWTNELLEPLGTRLPLTVTQEQVTYFAPFDLASFSPDRFPIWIWMDDPSFYGFPAFDGAGVKAAQDCGGREVTTDTRTFEPDQETFDRVRGFVEAHLPDALGPPVTKTCLYTLSPDRDFVIDAVPGHPEVLVALGAAHAFKFASLIGRALADLAIDGSTELDLEPFRIDRPALTMDDAPIHWLI